MTPTDRPAHPAKDGINAAVELFHRRWVLRILWELRDGALNFRQLRAACDDVSPSVLNQRLAELREARLVDHEVAAGYALTPHGQSLIVAMQPMMKWAGRWWRDVGAVTSA
jgi:DNA-binding HxlR family transcriptional regulator